MNKLLVTLLASAFAITAFAQAPKSDTAPKAPASAEKKTEKKAKAKGEKKSKAKAEKKAATK
jgi:Ni/Co efflux regulator RcnB